MDQLNNFIAAYFRRQGYYFNYIFTIVKKLFYFPGSWNKYPVFIMSAAFFFAYPRAFNM